MKPYNRILLLVILLSSALIATAVVLLLAIFNLLPVANFFIEFSLFVLGLIVPSLINFIIKLTDTLPWQVELRHLVRTGQIKRNEEIRISFAYVFAINVDGEYFLVMNTHGIGLYQCPAKTYRISEEKKREIKRIYNCREDDNIKRNYSDYRFFVPANKLKRFSRDFIKTHNPENGSFDYAKEFHDAFQCDVIKESHQFDNVTLHFKKKVMKAIYFDEYYQVYSLPMVDVFEVDLNEAQISLLRKLRAESKQTDEYLFATRDEIKTNGVIKNVNPRQTIAFNVKNIL